MWRSDESSEWEFIMLLMLICRIVFDCCGGPGDDGGAGDDGGSGDDAGGLGDVGGVWKLSDDDDNEDDVDEDDVREGDDEMGAGR